MAFLFLAMRLGLSGTTGCNIESSQSRGPKPIGSLAGIARFKDLLPVLPPTFSGLSIGLPQAFPPS